MNKSSWYKQWFERYNIQLKQQASKAECEESKRVSKAVESQSRDIRETALHLHTTFQDFWIFRTR